MAQNFAWIRKNMLDSPADKKERALSEIELKVQKSMQKLSIPEWYVNKLTPPPKIINATPIEKRPCRWRKEPDTQYNKPLITEKFPTGTFKINKKSSPRGPSCDPPKALEGKKTECNVNLLGSKTFPKVSPSRKIDNINLPLPARPIADSPRILDSTTSSGEIADKLFITPRKWKKPDTSVRSLNFTIAGMSDLNKSIQEPKKYKTLYHSFNTEFNNSLLDSSKPICSDDSDNYSNHSTFGDVEEEEDLDTAKDSIFDSTGKSLVSEIIEGLNEKCQGSSKTVKATPNTKLFVKKVVSALECPKIHICDSVEDISEMKSSSSSSSSLSYKESDSGSDCEQKTSFSSDRKVVKDEKDENVYWISLPRYAFPRTSSVLSMASSQSLKQKSPCLSPIRSSSTDSASSLISCNSYTSCNGARPKDRTRRNLRKIEECETIDSGYFDRYVTNF